MGNIAEQKLYLIQQISVLDDPKDLELLEEQLDKIKASKEKHPTGKATRKQRVSSPLSEEEMRKLAKPMRKKFDPEEMKREQGWTGKHDKEGMDRLIKEMNIQEPIEDLLAMLTK